MSRIYLASSWRNKYQPDAVAMLRAAGHEVYDFRNPPNGVPGFAWSEIDPEWTGWSAARYRDLLTTHPIAARGYMNDFRGMEWADTCVLLLPCGRSAHLEGGWFAGRGKRLIIWTHDGEEPELMALMANHIVTSSDELLAVLSGNLASVSNQKEASATSSINIQRADKNAPILRCGSADAIFIRAGTAIEIDGDTYRFDIETPVEIMNPSPGCDYAVGIDDMGKPFAAPKFSNPLESSWFAGFHFAPGGNARERSGGDDVPSINPYSLWDRYFRPNCKDPRGMTLVEANERRFWVDIYLLGVDHEEGGTSRYGAEIADGRSLPLLDFKTASDIYADHGKRLLTYDEFSAAAFGVTERSSADEDPEKSGLDAERTSKFGLIQATGNLWVWGTSGDAADPRPSLFGGSWVDGSGAGSRYAHLVYWPGISNEGISARGGSDHLNPA